MADTHIQWTDKTWNPTTGCDRVSPGCGNCYALTMANRLKGMRQAKYQNDGDPRTSGPGFLATEHEADLGAPLRWRKPAKVFVNSMSDLFHERISDEFIARVFAVMAATPRHTYQILTKRHGRMRSLLSRDEFRVAAKDAHSVMRLSGLIRGGPIVINIWPLPNVWLGVSVEDQKWADIRIPALLDTPASVRFLSCEPLLGPVHISRWLHDSTCVLDSEFVCTCSEPREISIDWVIVGGESGPGARSMPIEWATSIVDQCRAASVPVHVKQLGSVWAQQTRREAGWVVDPKGGDWGFWPEHLKIRDYPEVTA